MSTTHEKEQTLQRQIGREVESALPGVEVLAVELTGTDRFTVFVDHADGVDHALSRASPTCCASTCANTRSRSRRPASSARCAPPEHFRNAVGRTVSCARRSASG